MLTLPVAAAVQHQEDSFCWVKTADSDTEKRPLVVGPSDDQFIIVEDGVVAGEEVLLNPRAVVDDARKLALEPHETSPADKTFGEALRLGINSLLLHKLRSVLAALGIFIGTSAVIWLVAMGEGVSYQAQQQIKELGPTNIIVRSVKPSNDSASANSNSPIIEYGFLRDDYGRLRSNLPNINQAVPMREIRRELRVGDRTADTKLVGCTPGYLALNHLSMARGRFRTIATLARM